MQDRATTVLERFQRISPDGYRSQIEDLWDAATRLKDAVAQEVENGQLPVMTALEITSCIAATTLGYPSFHGEASANDLLTALAIGQTQTQNV